MIVDAIIIGIVGLASWRGWRRGLILSFTGFVGFIVATFVAVFGYRLLSYPLREGLKLSNGVSNVTAAIIIFLAVSIGFRQVGRIITRVLQLTKWRRLNEVGGAALAGGWALSFVTMVLLAISVIPAPVAIASNVERSAIAKGIVREAPTFSRTLARTDLRKLLNSLLGSQEERVSLVATTDFTPEPHDERLLLYLVNEERRARNLPALRSDAALARAARAHATDMYRRGYFAHVTPEGRTPGARLRRANISFAITGENIALAPTLVIAHNELMASAKHRAHILGRGFTRVGIAVLYGRQGLLIAEEFVG